MHRIAIAVAALILAEGSAIACMCVPLTDEEQKRQFASQIASEAVAVAEVVQVEPMDQEAMRSELYRVLRVHFGEAPESFRLARQMESGPGGEVVTVATSCDVAPEPGERTLVALYAPGESDSDASCSSLPQEESAAAKSLAIGSICDQMFLKSEGALDLIREEARKLKRQ